MTRDEILKAYGGGERDFSGANLSGADLRWADLSGANLSGANLSEVNLRWADLSGVNLSGANLSEVNLSEVNLRGVNLSEVNLSGANLRGVNLSGVNLSGAKGLLDPIVWLTETFEQTGEGIICYKVFGQYFEPVEGWVMEPASVIEEIVNPRRTDECGSGVNVATLQWIKANCDKDRTVWRCLIRWPWLAGVVIPYNTDGKFRAGRVELVEEIGIVEDL